MDYRNLNGTGLRVSEICLGTMQFLWTCSEEDSYKILDAFYESGGNFIDTADMYSQWAKGLKGGESETIIGRWLKMKKNRGKIVLATKVRSRMWEGPDGEGLGRSHILRACEESLRRLQVDAIDLYQSHWTDEKTPIEETLSAYGQLIKEGKVRHIGCSNYSGRALAGLLEQGKKSGVHTVCIQPYYNLIGRKDFESNSLPMVLEHKMAVIPYSPLAGGFLTGKYRKGKPAPKSERAEGVIKDRMNDKTLSVVGTLEEMSRSYGKTILQMALGWLLSHVWMTSPIIGANSVEQLRESLGASGFRLKPEDKRNLDQLTEDL